MIKSSERLLFGLLAVLLVGCPQFTEEDPNQNVDAGGRDTGPRESRQCTSIVTYGGDDGDADSPSSVAISGEFNDWDPEATPMTRSQGLWRAELNLPAGHYGFKFVIDGEYEGDPPPHRYTKWVGDTENRNLIVEDCNIPRWKIISSDVSDTGRVTATLKFQSSASGAPIDPVSLRVTVGGAPVEPQVDAVTGNVTISYQAPAHGKYSIKAWANDIDGISAENAPLWLPLWYEAEHFTWQDAAMYLIFTDRFRDSDGTSPLPPVENVAPIANFKGGDFRGITDVLEEGYFEDMGVNLLWLSPVNQNTNNGHIGGDGFNRFTGYHGYWTVDPINSEARYGDAEASSNERLMELIGAAQDRGIRVMFDLVLNQVHEDHIYCTEQPTWCSLTCVCGAPGCEWEVRPLDCQFAPYLPDLNYRNHELLVRVVDDVLAFMKKFDIDSVRIDAAKHMDHVIMRTIRLRLNELEAQGASPFYVVGETYVGADGHDLIMEYVADYELHSQFDFPLLYPIRSAFGHGGSFVDLENAVRTSEQKYGASYKWSSPFLGNHDIPRFSTESVGNSEGGFGNTRDLMAEGPPNDITEWNLINRMSMGYAFLLTLPGIPLMYYGDEVGLAGGPDPDNRRMMPWELNANQRELLSRVQALGKARQALRPLRHGSRQELWIDHNFYVYARDAGNGDVVIVAMNKSDETRTETVTIPPALELVGRTLRSINSERSVTVSEGVINVTLDSWEYAIFAVD